MAHHCCKSYWWLHGKTHTIARYEMHGFCYTPWERSWHGITHTAWFLPWGMGFAMLHDLFHVLPYMTLGKRWLEHIAVLKSLGKSCQKLDSWRANKTSCMLLYRYKVTKNIFCETFKVYLSPYWQNTVWNLAKCNSVTFWKSFRMFSFLKKMII